MELQSGTNIHDLQLNPLDTLGVKISISMRLRVFLLKDTKKFLAAINKRSYTTQILTWGYRISILNIPHKFWLGDTKQWMG